MQNFKPKLSIIIINYRSERYLTGCIASIYKRLSGQKIEIILVNNDPAEKLDHFLVHPEVKLIDVGDNLGFGAANNIGVKKASGKYIFFLNPDTKIASGNFEKMLEKMEADNEIGAIGPRLLTEDGKTQWWCAGKEISLEQLIKNNLGIIESKKIWESRNEILTDWVSGAAMLVRKDVFEKVRGFDENFFMYFEDQDLCRKIRKNGHKVMFYPQEEVLHYGGKSRVSFFRQKAHFFRSMAYFFKKN